MVVSSFSAATGFLAGCSALLMLLLQRFEWWWLPDNRHQRGKEQAIIVARVHLDTSYVVHIVDEKYASFTIDASIWRSVDFHNANLTLLAASLAPAILRVGGTQQDYDLYQFGPYENATCEDLPKPMTRYRCQTVNVSQWQALNQFCQSANLSLVFGLNDLFGRPTKTHPEQARCLHASATTVTYRPC